MKERLTAFLVACSVGSIASAIPITSPNNSDAGLSTPTAVDQSAVLRSSQVRPALDVGIDNQAETSVQQGVLSSVSSLPNTTPSVENQMDQGAAPSALTVNSVFNGNREIHLGRKEVPATVSVPERVPTGLLMTMAFSGLVFINGRFMRRKNSPVRNPLLP